MFMPFFPAFDIISLTLSFYWNDDIKLSLGLLQVKF